MPSRPRSGPSPCGNLPPRRLPAAIGRCHSGSGDPSKGDGIPKPGKACILPFIGLDLPSAMGDDLEHKGCHMQLDEPFPLEIVPSRVRHAMLDEFKGRRPTVGEVAQIPDAYWLATPAIGRKVLQTIRAVVHEPRP